MAEVTPLLSILIPYYNVEAEYFQRCMDTFRHEVDSRIEIIVVDDGSAPPYAREMDDICNSVPNKIHVCNRNNAV